MLDLCVCDAENKLYENGLIKEKDKVKFVIDNCAVVEKNIDGYYIYLVYNLMSLKKNKYQREKNLLLQIIMSFWLKK